tara:strand:+ start:3864 stop:4136 length:273 start_codon:yes stop_codon:yes gene_type:complete
MANTVINKMALTNSLFEYTIKVDPTDEEPKGELLFMQLPDNQTTTQIDNYVDFFLQGRKKDIELKQKEQEAIDKALHELHEKLDLEEHGG